MKASPYYFKMGQFHELRLRSNSFVSQIDSYIESIVDDNEALLDLNRRQLKEEHKTAKGKPVSPQYSRSYAAFKGFKTPNLFLTGEFQRAFTIEAKGKAFNISSSDDKTEKLTDKYGTDIFGISKEDQQDAQAITIKELAKVYKKVVFQS